MVLGLNSVGHRYEDGPWLFRGISVAIAPGSLVGITGPSGSGKSTLLAILGGLVNPAEGDVSRADGECAWVFQVPSGIPRRTAIDHISYPLLTQGLDRRAAELAARPILDRVGLADREQHEHRTLSGGEAQRLALAQAIASGHPFVLADEPTAQLDRATAASVVRTLSSLPDQDRVVVVATHDPMVMAACSSVLDLGGPAEPGSAVLPCA